MNGPVRLEKKPEENKTAELINHVKHFNSSQKIRMGGWIHHHPTLFLFIAMMIFAVIFTVLIFILVGVSAVESGTQYNHLQTIV